MPEIPAPEPIDFDDAQLTQIADHVLDVYDRYVQARTTGGYQEKHLLYEQMFRGETPPRPNKPWPGAADLHVQMPYWLVDSVAVRMTAAVWNQHPLVIGRAQEDADEQIAADAATLVEWHLGPERMNARLIDHRLSKMRLIHGQATGLVSYVTDEITHNEVISSAEEPVFDPTTGLPQVDETTGEVIVRPTQETQKRTTTLYDGPVLTPLSWDDVLDPLDCANLQPQRPSNPHGASEVIVRQWEALNLLFKKTGAYARLKEDPYTDRQWWKDHAPAQDRSTGTGSGSNQRRSRQHDGHDGISRSRERHRRQGPHENPEFEILTFFGPWEDPETGELDEMVLFVCRDPKITLGGFRLSDLHYKSKRPLYEKHYQTVGTRRQSMGLMEIVQHLSAELDTIHNMRMDIGFATNMPYYFYKDNMGFDPDEVDVRPLKGIPVQDPSGIVFPNVQGQTTFYIQEENLLYTLVERVVGVTDLFLGMSPTKGAAARHATGFVGTQQESLARTSEVINQDVTAFGWLCTFIYELELQYGPSHRAFRLLGRETPLSQRLTRQQLWMRGQYDFTLGANNGSYNQQLQQQQGQALLQLKASSQLMAMDPGRGWEAEAFYLRSIGFDDLEKYIGPKSALGVGSPKAQEEELGEMVQQIYGPGQPAPVHPSDDDRAHVQKTQAFLASPDYDAMGRPNEAGILQHAQLHIQQMTTKRQQQQAQAAQAAQGPGMNGQANGNPMGQPGQSPNGNGQTPQDNILPQMLAQQPTQTANTNGSAPSMQTN